MVLKRGRGKADGTLSLTGRDIEERELALSFHGEDGAWTLLGDAEEFGKSQQRQEIIEILRDQVPRTPKEIADLLGKRPNNIKNLLWKMGKEGAVKSHDGKYSL
jgi:hypothetical protein